MKLNLETNLRNPLDLNFHFPSGATLLLTAATNDRWLFRVKVSESLMLLAVPEFGGVNICAQVNNRCGCQLTSETPARRIVQRLQQLSSKNRHPNALLAVTLLQKTIKKWRRYACITRDS